jgi:hypothetical protein
MDRPDYLTGFQPVTAPRAGGPGDGSGPERFGCSTGASRLCQCGQLGDGNGPERFGCSGRPAGSRFDGGSQP